MKRLISSILLCMTGTGVLAQDQCRDILAAQLFNTATGTKTEQTKNAEFYWACGSSLSEARDYINNQSGQSQGGSVGGNYGPYGGSADYNHSTNDEFTEENLRTWKEENCSEVSSDRSRSAFEYYANSTVAGGVVQAWRDCMLERQNLTCWATPKGSNIEFTVNWRNEDTELPTITSASAVGEGVDEEMWVAGSTLYIGDDSYLMRRVATQDAFFNIKIRHRERYNFACSAYVPAVRTIIIAEPRPEPPSPIPVANYPNREISFIVGTTPGGSTDSEARSLASQLASKSGWTIVIQNKPGGSGRAALEWIKGQDPDGYSILVSQTTNRSDAHSQLKPVGQTGLFVPNGTPAGIITKIEQALRAL